MIVVNLFGGPGTGKSTTAAATFAELKYEGVNAELVTEFAKDKVWEKSLHVLGNQPYLIGKQWHRIWRLSDLDVVVTDSPLLLMLHYGESWGEAFKAYALDLHSRFPSLNFMLRRVKAYNPAGRVQTEEKARSMDAIFQGILDEHAIPYEILDADQQAPKVIARKVLELL